MKQSLSTPSTPIVNMALPLCPWCDEVTDQFADTGEPLVCNPCIEEDLELEVQEIEAGNTGVLPYQYTEVR
jgi:hypothetical protein